MTSFEIGQIIARAWADDAFKTMLLTDPERALSECKIDLPDGVDVKVHMNSERQFHIVIPDRPNDLEIPKNRISEARGGCVLPCRGDNSW